MCAYWVLSPLSYNMLLTSLCIVSSYIYIKRKKTTRNGIAVKVHRVCAKIWREHFKMMGWGEREKKIWHIRPLLIRKRHKSNLQDSNPNKLYKSSPLFFRIENFLFLHKYNQFLISDLNPILWAWGWSTQRYWCWDIYCLNKVFQ